MNFIIVFQQAVLSLEGLILGFFLGRMLDFKNEKPSRRLFLLYSWGCYMLVMLPNWLAGDRIPGWFNMLGVLLVFQILLRICFRDRLQTRLFAALLLYLMQLLADILISFLFVVLLKKDSVNFMRDNMACMLCIGVLLECALDWAACSLWNRYRKSRLRTLLLVQAGLIVLFFYLLFMAGILLERQGEVDRKTLAVILVSLSGTVLVLGLCTFFQQRQVRCEKAEQQSLGLLSSVRQDDLLELQNREARSSRLRHDSLNILAAADQLIEQNQKQEADQLLSSYLERLEDAA